MKIHVKLGFLFFNLWFCLFSGTGFAADPNPPVVVVIRHAGVWANDGTLKPDQVRRMVEMGLQTLTNKKTAIEAMKGFFRPEEKIALKVNAITANPNSATKPALTKILADLLLEIGVKPDHITIYDRTPGKGRSELEPSGYQLCDKTGKIQVRAGGTLGPKRKVGGLLAQFYSPIEEADALINLPVLKDHHIMGLTFALKNHLGSILKPASCHLNAGVPAIAELNMMAPIKRKQRLIVGDALCGQFNKGPHDHPEFHWKENAIILGIDPVAVDAVAFGILERVRKDHGLSWPKEMKYGGKAGDYLKDCAKRGVGNLQPKVLEVNCSTEE
ncbi:DUF362 domain-containing protein [bacterium]|nr:DUF362 domain-containing protein [bacterium]